MGDKPGATNWAADRGEKWRAHCGGMEATLAPVTEPLITALKLDAPYKIAEIGCGGGGTALEIAHVAAEGSKTHGFDISPALVELARSRIPEGETDIEFFVANGQTAPAPQIGYDRLVSRFGIMFFDDPAAAFKNLAGWLVPGGRFAFAVWGPKRENEWFYSVHEVLSQIVEVPKAPPDSPGPFRYAEASVLVKLLEGAGFRDVQVDDWRGRLSTGGGMSAPEAANFALSSFASFGDLLSQAGEEAMGRARQLINQRFALHEDGGVVRMNACAHIVTGTR